VVVLVIVLVVAVMDIPQVVGLETLNMVVVLVVALAVVYGGQHIPQGQVNVLAVVGLVLVRVLDVMVVVR